MQTNSMWLHWSDRGWVREDHSVHITFAELLTQAFRRQDEKSRQAALVAAAQSMLQVGAGNFCLTLSQRITDSDKRAAVVTALADVLVGAGQEDQAVQTARSLTHKVRAIETLKAIAVAQERARKPQAAQATEGVTVALKQEIKDERAQKEVVKNIHYMQQKDYALSQDDAAQKAQEARDAAIRTALQMTDGVKRANALIAIARVQALRGELAEACRTVGCMPDSWGQTRAQRLLSQLKGAGQPAGLLPDPQHQSDIEQGSQQRFSAPSGDIDWDSACDAEPPLRRVA